MSGLRERMESEGLWVLGYSADKCIVLRSGFWSSCLMTFYLVERDVSVRRGVTGIASNKNKVINGKILQ